MPHHEIDMDRWDQCISESINGSMCAYSWYLDLVADTWDAVIDDDYRTVMPLPWRKKFGLKYVYQPPFIQQLGLFSSDLINPERVKSFIEAIPLEFVLIDLNMNKMASLPENHFNLKENSNYELELISSYEILHLAYSENLRRNLKKAHQSGTTIVQNINPESIVNLFRQNRGVGLKSWAEKEYSTLTHLIYLLIHKQVATVFGVFDHRNELCAGAVFAEQRDRSIFLFSGLSQEGRRMNAMPLLIDNYIQINAGTHRILDFEGSNDAGLARFYASFGSRKHQYQSLRINRLRPIPKLLFCAYNRWKA